MTIGEAYGPAMEITDQAEADRFFDQLVTRILEERGGDRELTEKLQRSNLAYFAGYYDQETRLRVERLFKCAHPVFGAAAEKEWTPKEAFELGVRWAKKDDR